MKQTFILLSMILLCTACGDKHKKSANVTEETLVEQQFSADSAFTFCQQQCDFGPRTMNSEAHEQCGQWILEKFKSYGLEVSEQRATLTGFDGTPLKSNNITARYQPEQQQRILICAHWDSRPWADNDPDEANHQKPVMAANDGASGVAVMIELARVLSADTCRLPVGVDFVCFDAEDWGTEHQSDSWALGAQYWAKNVSIRKVFLSITPSKWSTVCGRQPQQQAIAVSSPKPMVAPSPMTTALSTKPAFLVSTSSPIILSARPATSVPPGTPSATICSILTPPH